jgi:hypothetical protein
MERYFQQNGYLTFAFAGQWSDLKQHLEKGRPLIAALKPGSLVPLHYVVVAGLSQPSDDHIEERADEDRQRARERGASPGEESRAERRGGEQHDRQASAPRHLRLCGTVRAVAKSIGERRLTVWLADQLAQSPKDRTLCELCVLANYDTAPDRFSMSRWPDRQLVDCMDNRQAPLAHRMVAAWLLSGSHEFHAVTVPRQSSRHHRHLIRLMVDRGLPRVLLYLAHRAVSRLREDMFVSLLFMHEMLLRTSATSFRQPTSIAAVMIGPLLAAAYDTPARGY